MEGILKVSPETLQSTAGEFQNINGQVKSTTDEMVNLIKNLKSVWEGAASDAFIGKVTGLQNDMDKIYRMINEHVTDLNDMAQTYIDAENVNTEAGSSLSSGILE